MNAIYSHNQFIEVVRKYVSISPGIVSSILIQYWAHIVCPENNILFLQSLDHLGKKVQVGMTTFTEKNEAG